MFNLHILAEQLALLNSTELQDLTDILVNRDHRQADNLDYALRNSLLEFLMAHGFSEKIIDISA